MLDKFENKEEERYSQLQRNVRSHHQHPIKLLTTSSGRNALVRKNEVTVFLFEEHKKKSPTQFLEISFHLSNKYAVRRQFK